MIKIVSFDIGGTILYSENINNYNLKKLTEIVNKPYELVRKSYKNVFQKQKGSLKQLVNNFCNLLDIKVNNEINSFFEEKFKDTNNISFIDKKAINIIKELKEIGYKIILFSNSCVLIKNDLNEEILKYIDEIFYSYDIGYTKDENESYKIIESKLQAKPEEFLHIGDTLKSDYLMPQKNGWNALFYGKSEDDKINKIEDLSELLDKLSGELWKGHILKKKNI